MFVQNSVGNMRKRLFYFNVIMLFFLMSCKTESYMHNKKDNILNNSISLEAYESRGMSYPRLIPKSDSINITIYGNFPQTVIDSILKARHK